MKPNIALTRFKSSQYTVALSRRKSHEHRRADRDGGDNGMRKNVIVTRDRGGGDTNTIVRHEHGFYSGTSLSAEQVKEAAHGCAPCNIKSTRFLRQSATLGLGALIAPRIRQADRRGATNRRSQKTRCYPAAGGAHPHGGRSFCATLHLVGDLRIGQKRELERYS